MSTQGHEVVLMFLLAVAALADNMAAIGIAPATGTVTVSKRWTVSAGVGGFHTMAQDLHIGGAANNFYSLSSSVIPAGGDVSAFKYYVPASGAATAHVDIGSKLTPDSYSGLTSADPDVGYGSVNLYFIHHKGTTDYFSVLVPSSGTASSVTDLKPMSGPGGPGTVTGINGYVALTFAAANLGYGANMFYYLRSSSGKTIFGSLSPGLAGASKDLFTFDSSDFTALVFASPDVGFGVNKMFYLRTDSVTGYSIMGLLDPVSGALADVANLGGKAASLPFSPSDLGFGSGMFYTVGSFSATYQSVSFAAIRDRPMSAGAFNVRPSASSGLPIALTVVSGSTGSANISGPFGGVFTVTPTTPGRIILQATQAGASTPAAFDSNMLRQSFTSGSAINSAFRIVALVLSALLLLTC